VEGGKEGEMTKEVEIYIYMNIFLVCVKPLSHNELFTAEIHKQL
jgi:hypothetical protein